MKPTGDHRIDLGGRNAAEPQGGQSVSLGLDAVLTAKGGSVNSTYAAGGGGRIAIGTGLTSAQVDALLTTGRCGRKAHGLDVFTNEFAEVTVNVRGGEADGTVEPVQSRLGTFNYYGKPKGMLIIIK